MLKEYDIYLAGPFFNEAQKAKMDKVKVMLQKIGYIVADPRDLGPVIVDSSETVKTSEFFKKIFAGNIEGMKCSLFCVACLDERDIGTAFELGWCFANKKTICSFTFDGGKTNVMLGQAVNFHATSFDELEAMFIEEFDNFKSHGSYWAPSKVSYAGSDE